MQISIITAVYNRCTTIGEALDSLHAQRHGAFEHVIVDGGSTDGTLELLRERARPGAVILSGPDAGIYDALNKGLARATGEVVGLLHSDDMFADAEVLTRVAEAFTGDDVLAVYGDLHYVSRGTPTRVVRHWRSGEFHPGRLRYGWMPPHPALFVRRSVVERFGGYDTSFRIAGDYDAILRYFSSEGFRARYIPQVLVKMRVGGESNRSLGRILAKSREDWRAIRKNGIGGPHTLACKNFRKIGQFIATPRPAAEKA
jgi:glycosyltransferase involved in cell wall biosynthesis